MLQLHLGDHQGRILPLEHIEHPVAAGQIQAMAALHQSLRGEGEKGLGICRGNGVFEFEAAEGKAGQPFPRGLKSRLLGGEGVACRRTDRGRRRRPLRVPLP